MFGTEFELINEFIISDVKVRSLASFLNSVADLIIDSLFKRVFVSKNYLGI